MTAKWYKHFYSGNKAEIICQNDINFYLNENFNFFKIKKINVEYFTKKIVIEKGYFQNFM